MDENTRACSVQNCSRRHWSRGMCSLHYQRWRKHGSTAAALRAANGTSTAGCSMPACGYVDPHGLVRGLCRMHYQRKEARYQIGKPPIVARSCAHCGKVFTPKKRDDRGRPTIYCSRECKGYAKFPTLAQTCAHCGEQFTTRRSTQLLCSEPCRRAAHRLQSKFRSRTGEPTAPGVWRAKIAERDRWHCGICGEPVNPQVKYPDPLQATLDHIVPVSRGGTNDPTNLRLAHMSCNRSRGNRMEAHASV